MREGIAAKREFTGFFDVTPEKAEHVARIVKNQEKLLKIGKDEVDVFVNIRFVRHDALIAALSRFR